MHEEYGESNDKYGKHKCCEKCGCCITCRDCKEYGCGLDNKSLRPIKKRGEKNGM